MKKPYVLLLFSVLAMLQAEAQRSEAVAATTDKAGILIGQSLQLTLEATFSNPHTVSFFQVDSLPHFEIQDRSRIDTQTRNNQTVLTQTFKLTSWDSGAWVIPALALPAVKGITTKPIPITVAFTPMQPDQDYHDIKDIVDVPKPPRTTWYWYVIGAVVLLLLLLLVFPKNKKESQADVPLIKEGAYKVALKNLEVLQGKSGLDDNDYFTELILILRTYLQQGKGIHSFQQTTDDLSRQLQQLGLPPEDFKKLVQTLQVSDFVKFARYTVTEAERSAAWTEIRNSIMAIEQKET
jgi:hypothetical protein